MKILVTGAGGYIGTLLTKILLKKQHEVVAIDRFLFGETLEGIDGVEKISDDIRYMDKDHLSSILRDVDGVIDLAALSNDPVGDLNPLNTITINHLGRFRIASLSKTNGVPKYILPSSCSIYGFNDEYVDESSTPNPLTTYAKANLMIERDSMALNSEDFSVVVFRLATVYGLSARRMRFDLVINDVVGQIFTKGFTTLTTGGTQWRPFVHVADVCKGLISGLESNYGGEVFNLGSDEHNYQIKNVVKEIFSAIDKEENYQWTGSPDRRSYKVRFHKIRKEMNFRPDWNVGKGALEVWNALEDERIKYGDERTITVKWYKKLIEQGVQL